MKQICKTKKIHKIRPDQATLTLFYDQQHAKTSLMHFLIDVCYLMNTLKRKINPIAPYTSLGQEDDLCLVTATS